MSGPDLSNRSIGSIVLHERLGEGGMGTVYRGFDDRLDRDVAVKVLRADQRSRPASAARFRREARLLSRLEHPGICRVYDLLQVDGHDALVMELVRGETLRDRLRAPMDRSRAVEIAIAIASGLEAAHSMSVVHRDLKPENIMITEGGDVRVLDFGIARSLGEVDIEADGDVVADGDMAERVLEEMTQTGDVLGTPRYMSPEQARGEPVTAASDLFSLGLILQEMASGTAPFPDRIPLPELHQRAMWGDVDRAPGGLGPLQSLVDRLLDQNPTRRPSAADTVRILQRIQSRPRRRAIQILTGAALLSVVVALVAVSIGYVRTQKALAIEAASRERSEAMRDFLAEVLSSGDPSVRGADTRVADVLSYGAGLIEERLAEHPHTRAIAHQAISVSYRGLGLYEEAIEHGEKAMHLLEATVGSDHDDALVAAQHLSVTYRAAGRLQDAESLSRQTLDTARRTLSREDPNRWVMQEDLGIILGRLARYDEAEELLTEARNELVRLTGSFGDHSLRATAALGSLYHRTGRVEEALGMYRELEADMSRALGPKHPDTLIARSNLANLLRTMGGHDEEAEARFLAVIADKRDVLGDTHPSTLSSLSTLGLLYKNQGRVEEAESVLRQVLEDRRRVLGPRHPEVANVLNTLGPMLGRSGRFDEADAVLREAIGISEEANGPGHPYTLNAMGNLANLEQARGRPDEGIALLRDARDRALEQLGPLDRTTEWIVRTLAERLAETGARVEALAVIDDQLQRLEEAEAAEGPRYEQLVSARDALRAPTGSG